MTPCVRLELPCADPVPAAHLSLCDRPVGPGDHRGTSVLRAGMDLAGCAGARSRERLASVKSGHVRPGDVRPGNDTVRAEYARSVGVSQGQIRTMVDGFGQNESQRRGSAHVYAKYMSPWRQVAQGVYGHETTRKLAGFSDSRPSPDSKSRAALCLWRCGAAIACGVTYRFRGADLVQLLLLFETR